MSALNLHNQINQDTVTIPGIFIDEYMPYASGEFVKIYLYLLHAFQKGNSFSVLSMADSFNLTEKDVMRALAYWEKSGLLRLNFNSDHNLTDISLLDIPEKNKLAEAQEEAVKKETASAQPSISAVRIAQSAAPVVHRKKASVKSAAFLSVDSKEKQTTLPESISEEDLEALADDDSFRELLFVAQTYLKRTLKPSDCDLFGYWYLLFNHSYDIVEYLVEYCVEQGHANMKYMEAVALSWHKHGLQSVSAIKDYAESHNKIVYSIMKGFGISDRSPVPKESDFIKKWTRIYNFSLDMILKACEKTMSAIHSPSFEYTDSILSAWKKANITTLEQVASIDQEFQNQKQNQKYTSEPRRTGRSASSQFHNFKQRTTDYDQLIANYYGYKN